MTTMTAQGTDLRHRYAVDRAGGQRRARSASGTGLRLTTRGRVVVVAVAALLLLAAFSLGRVGSQAATRAGRAPAVTATTVHAGETLWSVAARIAPRNDPREVVSRLRQLNHLTGSDLLAGQQLLLPATAS